MPSPESSLLLRVLQYWVEAGILLVLQEAVQLRRVILSLHELSTCLVSLVQSHLGLSLIPVRIIPGSLGALVRQARSLDS